MHHPALTIYAVFFTYMACMFLHCASGRTWPSRLGIKCAEDCMLYESESKCQMMTEEGKSLTLYCSLEQTHEYSQEHDFTSLFCEIDDEYYSCQVEESVGYSEKENEKKLHYTSFYGDMCSDICGKHGENYFWCHTPKGWDYCSIKENVDYQDNACREDHPCEKHGERYYWCKREDDGWGYCGLVEAETPLPNCPDISEEELHYSNAPTLDWLHSDSYWNYLEIILLGIPFLTKPGQHHWRKKRNNDKEILAIKTDRGNCVEVIFTACQDYKAVADGRSRKSEIRRLIAKWENRYLRMQATSQLIRSENLRIDLQGLVRMEHQRYYNLQIQLNVPRNRGESTTVSQVLIPMDFNIPNSYVRRAFLESFLRRAKVVVKVKKIEPCKNKNKLKKVKS